MLLQTAAPQSTLAPWVHSYRLYRFTGVDDAGMTLYPGTGAEIWVVLSGQLYVVSHPRSDGLLCLRHRSLNFTQNALTVFAVRLKAGALPFFVRAGINPLIDHFTPLEKLWGDESAIAAYRVRGAENFEAQCHVAGIFLQGQMQAGRKLEPMQELAATLYETCADFSLSDFCAQWQRHRCGISHSFHETQGVSIKYYHRLCRFERLVRDGLFSDDVSLSDLSLKYGYYDQAHMNRDVRQLSSLTPLRLFGQPSARLFYAPRRSAGL